MKKVVLNLIVCGMICFTTNGLAQQTPTKTPRSPKEKVKTSSEKTPKRIGTMSRNANGEIKEISRKNVEIVEGPVDKIGSIMPSVSTITGVPERVKYKRGFLVTGVAGPENRVEMTNKVRWKQKGYNYERVKEYEVIKVTSESDGRWDAKMENPYRGVPEEAYNIKFEISSHQFPQDIRATIPEPTIVYGTMAPPEIGTTDGDVYFASNKAPGGMYPVSYTTISGRGIPNMDIKLVMAAEYKSHTQRYNTGDTEMTTFQMDGETETSKISSNGTWSVKVKIPNPYSLNRPYGVYAPKLLVTATQSASASDVSAEAKKRFDE